MKYIGNEITGYSTQHRKVKKKGKLKHVTIGAATKLSLAGKEKGGRKRRGKNCNVL